MGMHHQSEWGPRAEREPRDEVHILGKNSEPFWPFLDGLTLINLEQAKIEEVFLPYLIMPSNKTLFETMERNQFLLPEKHNT